MDMLLPISGIIVMKLSMYMYIFPWGSTGVSTTKGLLRANGMEMSWVDGGGIESLFGDWVSFGSQFLFDIRAFTGSAIGSEIFLHSDGPFAPPKVSLIDMITYNVPFQLI